MGSLDKRRRKRHLSSVPAGPKMQHPIVAAVRRVTFDSSYSKANLGSDDWQVEAWRQYDLCGELRFACTWLGNALSRCRLYVADVNAEGEIGEESQDQAVQATLSGLTGNPAKVAEILGTLGTSLTVPGEAYILAELNADDPDEDAPGAFSRWSVLSTEEIKPGYKPGTILVDRGNGDKREVDLDAAILMRVYRPHPRKHEEADSPTRAALPSLRELEQLSKYVFALIDSRLAGNGILAMPNEFTFPAPQDTVLPGEDAFMTALTEAMVTPIKDRNDASSVVPIVIKGPGDQIGNIHHLTFASPLAPEINDMRDRAIKRLALAMDMPPEVLLGVGGTNHWNAEYIDEASIKVHIEPALTLLCGALTDGFLRPALEAEGIESEGYTVWFDSSELVLRPDRAEDAKWAVEHDVIGLEAARRELGFTDDDAPRETDPEVLAINKAIALVTNAPSLAQSPGLPALAAAIYALFKNGVDENAPSIDERPDPGGLPNQPGDEPAPPDPGADAPPAPDATPPVG